MTVCKFFLEGRCSFGSSCRNEHPGDTQQRNNNRFGATDSSTSLRGRIGFPGPSSDYAPTKIYDDRSVRADLSKDRPVYKYSAYGPSKEEPNLLEGTDFSPEELRVQYYNIMSTNGVDTQYRAGVKDLEDRMQGQIEAILRDVRSALNRFDAKRQQHAQQQAQQQTQQAFGQPQPQPQPEPQQQQGAYGSPSVLASPAPAPSATPSLFGSSINQPNQPSLFGSSYNPPAAATPSIFGSNPSGFGTSSFGGTSSLGYPGPQAQPNTGSIFGSFQPQPQPQPQQPNPQQQYLLQMQQQQELLAQQQQQQQQQMLQQQMLQQQQQMQQQQQQPPSQPGNTQGTINNTQMQAFASSEFELYKIPEIPPPSDYRR